MQGSHSVLLQLGDLEVQTGRDPHDWLIVTPHTAEMIATLPEFDPVSDGQGGSAGVAVPEKVFDAMVSADGEQIGSVEDVIG